MFPQPVSRVGSTVFVLSLAGASFLFLASCSAVSPVKANSIAVDQVNELYRLWNLYKYTDRRDCRVVECDEGCITTSEGQGYAMLRAVWSNDQTDFDLAWAWTRANLQTRGDHLFAWKWKNAVLDTNSATDAD